MKVTHYLVHYRVRSLAISLIRALRLCKLGGINHCERAFLEAISRTDDTSECSRLYKESRDDESFINAVVSLVVSSG